MSTGIETMTAEALLQLPQDGFRYELVHGELHKMTPAGGEHGKRGMRLAWRLAAFVEQHDLGAVFLAETGFKLASDPDTVRAPDVSFVSQNRLKTAGAVSGFWPGAPDLAVEVVSPNDTYAAVEEKVQDFLRAGTQAVWVVNLSRRTIAVYRASHELTLLTDADTLSGESIIPGFTCLVRDALGE